MPKAPRPTTERKELPPQKKRVYDVIPDGVPEAAAFLVLDKGYSVAYAAKIMHVKRNALSKHIQKFRDARQLARAKRRGGSTANTDNVSSEQGGDAVAVVQTEAVGSDSPMAQDDAGAVQPIAATSDVAINQVAPAQPIVATTDLPSAQDGATVQSIVATIDASAQLAAAVQLQAASDASTQVVAVAQSEPMASDSPAQVAAVAQSIAVTNALSAPEAVVAQPQPAAASFNAAAGVALAECTCCARCQEQKKKFQEGVVI